MKLLKKLLIYLIPFALLLALFVVFEPYDYWGLKGNPRYFTRSVSSLRELLRERPENIVLGDSRMANLNADYIEQVSGERWAMLCYGSATLNENIEQFWYAAERTELKRVMFGVNFYNLSDIHYYEQRFETARELAESPLEFLTNFDIWLDMLGNLQAAITGREVDDPSSLEQNPQPPSEYNADGYRADLERYSKIIFTECEGYKGAVDYLERLDEIIDYCDAHGIEITFVLLNSSRAVWDFAIEPLDIGFYIDNYKDRLKSRATVYDMEFDNEYAANDAFFYDGLHVVRDEKLHLARIFFADEPSEYCVRTTKEQYLAEKAASQEE